MTKTGRRLAVVVATLAVGGVVFWWVFVRKPVFESLPSVDEIATMEASIRNPRMEYAELLVPQESWESIRRGGDSEKLKQALRNAAGHAR